MTIIKHQYKELKERHFSLFSNAAIWIEYSMLLLQRSISGIHSYGFVLEKRLETPIGVSAIPLCIYSTSSTK